MLATGAPRGAEGPFMDLRPLQNSTTLNSGVTTEINIFISVGLAARASHRASVKTLRKCLRDFGFHH